MSDWITRVVTAAACFGLSGLCLAYLFRCAKRVRWSRSTRQFVARHPNQVVFWTKCGIVASGAFLGLAMGVLLLVLHRHVFQPSAGSKPLLENVDVGPTR